MRIRILIDHPAWVQERTDAVALVRRAARAGLAAGAPGLLRRAGEVVITLADDERLRAINRSFRDKDKPTNVLSFPLFPALAAITRAPQNGAPLLLGDVVLSLETTRAEAAAQNKSFAGHVQHLVIHGILHLLGHDHQDDSAARIMEALEVRVLAGLGVGDPYA